MNTDQTSSDVELRGVTKSYGGRTVVDNVTLAIRRGEFFSLLGPSGCGKTTLLRMIAGFEAPDAGSVLLGGVDVTGVPVHKRDLNLVFQNYALFPHMTVGKNIAFGLKMQAVPDPRPMVASALEKVRLPGYENRIPGTLSGGEQQRVAVARAVVNDPVVILADEPTAALDTERGKAVMDLLRQLGHERQAAVIVVTHDERMIQGFDRVYHMTDGKITNS